MKKKKINLLYKKNIKKIEKKDGKLLIYFENDNEVKKFDTVLIAIGRETTISNLNLKNINLNIDKNNFIVVNELNETNIENIFAVGDVNYTFLII
jgi:pyruvate/2-oxoglutarate dehydrogenase complex dihydrolipoamide dehydrogenase (E3) component